MPLIRESLDAGKNVRFSPRGTSMLPMLRQGRDSIVLSPVTGKLKKYDLPFYQRRNGQYVLHRIVKSGDTYTCIGDNQYVFEHGVCHDQIIAVATAFYRDDRRISCNSFCYRFYCRYWHYSRSVRPYYRRCKSWIRRRFK